jgi:hypothetical protein
VVKCGFDERDFRMQADPEVFFTTDHYRGYPSVLIRLTKVRAKDLRDVLEVGWRLAAPKKLLQGTGTGQQAPVSRTRGGRANRPDA